MLVRRDQGGELMGWENSKKNLVKGFWGGRNYRLYKKSEKTISSCSKELYLRKFPEKKTS